MLNFFVCKLHFKQLTNKNKVFLDKVWKSIKKNENEITKDV